MLFDDVATVEQQSLNAEQDLVDIVRDQVSRERAFLDTYPSSGTPSGLNVSAEVTGSGGHRPAYYRTAAVGGVGVSPSRRNANQPRPSVLARVAQERGGGGLMYGQTSAMHHNQSAASLNRSAAARSVLHNSINYSMTNRVLQPAGIARCTICNGLHHQTHMSATTPHLDLRSNSLGKNRSPATAPICHCCGYHEERVPRDENLVHRIDTIASDIDHGAAGGASMVRYINDTLSAVESAKEERKRQQEHNHNFTVLEQQPHSSSRLGSNGRHIEFGGGHAAPGPGPAQQLYQELLSSSTGPTTSEKADITPTSPAPQQPQQSSSSAPHTESNLSAGEKLIKRNSTQPPSCAASSTDHVTPSESSALGGGAGGSVSTFSKAEQALLRTTPTAASPAEPQAAFRSMPCAFSHPPPRSPVRHQTPPHQQQHYTPHSPTLGVSQEFNAVCQMVMDTLKEQAVVMEEKRRTMMHVSGGTTQTSTGVSTPNTSMLSPTEREQLLQQVEAAVSSRSAEAHAWMKEHLLVVESKLEEVLRARQGTVTATTAATAAGAHSPSPAPHHATTCTGGPQLQPRNAQGNDEAIKNHLSQLNTSLEHQAHSTNTKIEQLTSALATAVEEVHSLKAAMSTASPLAVKHRQQPRGTGSPHTPDGLEETLPPPASSGVDVVVSPLDEDAPQDFTESNQQPPRKGVEPPSGPCSPPPGEASMLSIEAPEEFVPQPTPSTSGSPSGSKERNEVRGVEQQKPPAISIVNTSVGAEDANSSVASTSGVRKVPTSPLHTKDDQIREKDHIISEQRKMLIWLQEQQRRLQGGGDSGHHSHGVKKPHDVSIEDPREDAPPAPSAGPCSRSPTPTDVQYPLLPQRGGSSYAHNHKYAPMSGGGGRYGDGHNNVVNLQPQRQRRGQQYFDPTSARGRGTSPPLRGGSNAGSGGGSSTMHRNPIRDLRPPWDRSTKLTPSEQRNGRRSSSISTTANNPQLSYTERHDRQVRSRRSSSITDVTRPTSSSFAHATPRYQATVVMDSGYALHHHHNRHCADEVCEQLDLH